MAIRLSDDGTMDTVLICTECGEDFRFSFNSDGPENYDSFVKDCIQEIGEEHECEPTKLRYEK